MRPRIVTCGFLEITCSLKFGVPVEHTIFDLIIFLLIVSLSLIDYVRVCLENLLNFEEPCHCQHCTLYRPFLVTTMLHVS